MSPKIVTTCGARWEPQHLIDDYLKNFSWCDDHVIIWDRERSATDFSFPNERFLYEKERELAHELEADWILVVSPDERMEERAEEIIRQIMEDDPEGEFLYRFPNRELYNANQYRVDGTWGDKLQTRLYKWKEKQRMGVKKLHNNPCPVYPPLRRKTVDLNLYHLKHCEEENRKNRARIYKELDPENKYNSATNCDYLADDRGMILEDIPEGREYSPPYTKSFFWDPFSGQYPD